MRKRTFASVALALTAALAVVEELVTRDGIGALEYVVGVAIVGGLVLLATRLVVRDRRSRPA
jgi:hypothetical protein